MSHPRVVAVTPSSPAARAGVVEGDVILHVNGQTPRDVIAWHQLVDEPSLLLEVQRRGTDREITVEKAPGEPLGVEVDSPVFDRVQTCDNHCEFCFIYQLPKGLRRSLYVKDDDYRLSFLYGNFTTLTRFTEADLERVVTERLSPLYVSIHATDPDIRVRMLRNRRGATSLRWLRALLDHGVEVHGQIVVCPGVNDGPVLVDTMAGILDEYPELASAGVVPLGVSKHTTEAAMRAHTRGEAEAVVELVGEWQGVFLNVLGRRLVHAADEYYLLAQRPFPSSIAYEDYPQLENGIGMAAALADEFAGRPPASSGHPPEVAPGGFFSHVDGAPAAGYRAPRTEPGTVIALRRDARPVAVLSGEYGSAVLRPYLSRHERRDIRLVTVENSYFGGNIGVTGLLVGEDLARVLETEPDGHRYLLPDVCLSGGQFLDGSRPEALPRPVEIVPTEGGALRRAVASAPLR
jgi:putative radical SAM enzyme (TIGR03279 family)